MGNSNSHGARPVHLNHVGDEVDPDHLVVKKEPSLTAGVRGFGFRASSFEFRDSAFGISVSGFGIRGSGFGVPVGRLPFRNRWRCCRRTSARLRVGGLGLRA